MGARLDAIMKEANKKAKEEILSVGLNSYNYTRIPFTSPRMNYCTFGGIPVGKITEFYGEEHGGKTTSALDIVANYQQMPNAKDVLYIDAENRLDVEWAKKLDVDIDKMYILQPKGQSAEEIFRITYDAVESGDLGLWILDSVGVLMSEQEVEKDIGESSVGGISKALTMFGKKIVGPMTRTSCTGININQYRDVIGSRFPMKTTVGGNAWRYYCTARLEFSRGQFLDEKGNTLTRAAESPVGNIVLMSMTKNSSCPPTRRTGEYTINYEYGIDYLKDLIEVAIRYDIVRKSGSWFELVDIETGELLCDEKIQGQVSVYNYLEENNDVLLKVEQLVNNSMGILN